LVPFIITHNIHYFFTEHLIDPNTSNQPLLPPTPANMNAATKQNTHLERNKVLSSIFNSDPADLGLLVHILGYAASLTSVPYLAATCKSWDDIINKNEVTSTSIWRNIDPDLTRIYHLCPESQSAINHVAGLKELLQFRKKIEYNPVGKYGRLKKRLKTVFRHEAISTYYETAHMFKSEEEHLRSRGVSSFSLFVYTDHVSFRTVPGYFRVGYNDTAYVLTNWEAEKRIIERWFGCWGLSDGDFTIERPYEEGRVIRAWLNVDLNDVDLDGISSK
jgi:hypothetical protein